MTYRNVRYVRKYKNPPPCYIDRSDNTQKCDKDNSETPAKTYVARSENPTVWFAKNSTVEMFLISLENNKKLQKDSKKIYRLAIDNSIRNQNLLPLHIIRKYCFKIPENSIRYAELTKNKYVINYLKNNKWLSSLGGF